MNKCKFCGTNIDNKRKFCSNECCNESKVTSVECFCETCGKSFMKSPCKEEKRFCSRPCMGVGYSGNGNPAYIGDHLDVRGYVLTLINGKQHLLHRIIMEKHIGRKLTKDEHVHHINGIECDNDINNLQLMTNSEHCSHHNKLR